MHFLILGNLWFEKEEEMGDEEREGGGGGKVKLEGGQAKRDRSRDTHQGTNFLCDTDRSFSSKLATNKVISQG